MAELDEYKEDIIANINHLEDTINRSPLFNNDRQKWRGQVNAQIREINKEILLLEEGMHDLPDSQASHYVGSIKSFKKKIQKLEADVDKRERGESYSAASKQPIIQTAEEKRENARQQLFNKGDQALDNTKMAVTEMKKMAEQGVELAAQINLELTAQIQQLDRMRDKVMDTESTLKRAQKNITYFAKALECDKCMIGLLGLILLALVAVIVLAVKKNKEQ